MDILFKLRLAFWLMVLALWGTLVYQYLGGGAAQYEPAMQWVQNPFPKRPATPQLAAAPSTPRPASRNLVKPLAPLPVPPSKLPGMRRRPVPTPPPRHEYIAKPRVQTPSGFYKSETNHFIVFSELEPASQNLLDTLETLHANLMLDLAAFSPWAHDEQVSIYLFRSQENYRRVTGRPPWSGGASSISRRKIYLYGSEEQMGIIAHELCHIYFDSFFNGGKPDPLWLSEGMATLVQVERGLASPNWLPENLNILYEGGGYHLPELMDVQATTDADDSSIRLWYAESYSVVRFLVRAQWRSSFFRFCRLLREGKSVDDALQEAYKMPFDRVAALEYAWRYDLQTHRITGLRGLDR